jgi:hypothetical protein
MMGFAQKATLRMYPSVTKRNNMANLSPMRSPSQPMIKGTSAPPNIPKQSIPEKGE